MAWRSDFENAPKDGTLIDLWVWRGERGIADCYFPKMDWSPDGYWFANDDWETTVHDADFWRSIDLPGELT